MKDFMSNGLVQKSLNFITVCGLITACGDMENTDEGNVTSSLQLSPPAGPTLSRDYVVCPLQDSALPSTWRGRSLDYKSSAEIDYARNDWASDRRLPISWEGYDSSLLGFPGYQGSSRFDSVDVPVNLRMTAVDIRKVDGELRYHYFTNETARNPIENWSSTKSVVMTMAAHKLRQSTGYRYGMRSKVAGTPSWIGDHVNEVARTSDNGTAMWFKSFVGSQGSDHFMRNWLTGHGSYGLTQSFGGGHGVYPKNLGSRFAYKNESGRSFSINRSWNWNGQSNTVTPLTMAEFWKRLAVNRQDARTWLKKTDYTSRYRNDRSALFTPSQDFSVTDEDLQVILHGYVGGNSVGGMLRGAIQSSQMMTAMGGAGRWNRLFGDANGQNARWRFYGKTGSGYNGARGRDEAAFGGFICIPADSRNQVLKEGRLIAFFMNIQSKQGNNYKYYVRNTVMKNLVNTLIPEINGSRNLWTYE